MWRKWPKTFRKELTKRQKYWTRRSKVFQTGENRKKKLDRENVFDLKRSLNGLQFAIVNFSNIDVRGEN